MFVMTREWLEKYYGSSSNQVKQALGWLMKYGKDLPPGVLAEWSKWKHLAEYQPNTPDIIPQCLEQIDMGFESELYAHRFVNLLRVPLASAYEEALQVVKPRIILELGVGGDSAISTAVFLAWVESIGGKLISVDHHKLGMTWERYKEYHDKIWYFVQKDSREYLKEVIQSQGRFDMVFIDSSHSYKETKEEMELSKEITKFMLMDDALFEGNEGDEEKGGVKRAIEEWLGGDRFRYKQEFWGGQVVLLGIKQQQSFKEKKGARLWKR